MIAKMAVKKIIATTVNSRKKGMRRREAGWILSDQETITTQRTTATKDARVKVEAGTRSGNVDFPTYMRKIETITMKQERWIT